MLRSKEMNVGARNRLGSRHLNSRFAARPCTHVCLIAPPGCTEHRYVIKDTQFLYLFADTPSPYPAPNCNILICFSACTTNNKPRPEIHHALTRDASLTWPAKKPQSTSSTSDGPWAKGDMAATNRILTGRWSMSGTRSRLL